MLLLSIPLGYFLLVNDPSTKKIKKIATTSSSSSTASPSSPAPPPQLQRQIIVIGGSTGIGYAIATAAALDASPRTTRIVIVARNVSKLQVAQQALTNIIQEKKKSTGSGTPFSSNTTTTTTTIEMVSADVTDPIAITKAAQEIMTSSNTTAAASTITHLFLCVGEAQPRHHAEITPEQYHQATLMNQLGTIYTTNAFLPYLKNRLPSPTVATNTKAAAAAAATFTTTGAYSTMTYTCSMGGQCGVYGYTSYTPTKFALRGYVESLHMELYADNNSSSSNDNSTTRPVYVQIAYPPDTDTPGFSRENVHKPTLTHLISAVAGLALPESVGTTMYRAATTSAPQLRYQIYFNFDGFLLCTLASGFTPVTTWMDAVFQMTIMNFVRIIALFYLNDWHRIILKYHRTNPTTTIKDPLYGSTTSAPRSKDDTVANTATTKTSSISNESTKIDWTIYILAGTSTLSQRGRFNWKCIL